MFLIYALILLVTTYVLVNDKLDKEKKQGYFTVVAIFIGIAFVLSILFR